MRPEIKNIEVAKGYNFPGFAELKLPNTDSTFRIELKLVEKEVEVSFDRIVKAGLDAVGIELDLSDVERQYVGKVDSIRYTEEERKKIERGESYDKHLIVIHQKAFEKVGFVLQTSREEYIGGRSTIWMKHPKGYDLEVKPTYSTCSFRPMVTGHRLVLSAGYKAITRAEKVDTILKRFQEALAADKAKAEREVELRKATYTLETQLSELLNYDVVQDSYYDGQRACSCWAIKFPSEKSGQHKFIRFHIRQDRDITFTVVGSGLKGEFSAESFEKILEALKEAKHSY